MMNKTTSALSVLAVLSCLVSSAAGLGTNRQNARFTCKIGALSAEERSDLPKVLDQLIELHPFVTELRNGYSLKFARNSEAFPLAAKWISCESRCCQFFDFAITIAPNNGPLTIRITGPAGVKAFIADDLPKIHALTTART